jgi:hypothetical protein
MSEGQERLAQQTFRREQQLLQRSRHEGRAGRPRA